MEKRTSTNTDAQLKAKLRTSDTHEETRKTSTFPVWGKWAVVSAPKLETT